MRRKTRQIHVGEVIIGGNAPITIQSMTTMYTRDVEATVAQIRRLEDVGCELVRVAVPEKVDVQALSEIKKQIHIPLIADIHYNPLLALQAIEQGVDGIRINPGNLLHGRESFKQIVQAAKKVDCALRIGVNSGSLDALERGPQMRKVNMKMLDDGTVIQSEPVEERRKVREELAQRMVDKALEFCGWTEDLGFTNYKVSLKSSNVLTAVEAYRRFAATNNDIPLHLGITEAGTRVLGAVKTSVGFSLLLAEGIGDTIRVSLSAEPEEEVPVAYEILRSLELRQRGVTFVSCPSCGRVEIDVIKIASEVEKRLSKVQTPIQVAVMGCVVNGPGESRDADIGLSGGRGKGVIYKKGQYVRTVPEHQFLEAVLQEVASILPEAEGSLVYPGEDTFGPVTAGRTRKTGIAELGEADENSEKDVHKSFLPIVKQSSK